MMAINRHEKRIGFAGWAGIVCASCAAIIVVLLAGLDAGLVRLGEADQRILWTVHAHGTARLTALMLALTDIGAIRTFVPAVLLAGIWIWWRGDRYSCAVLGYALLGALLLNESLKLAFHRARPVLSWSIHDEPTYSFPSGHALFSTVLYGVLAYLAWRTSEVTVRRVMVVLPAIVLPLSIGYSRIYLGEHFPSDVLAGYLAGLIWLGGVVVVANRYRGVHWPIKRV